MSRLHSPQAQNQMWTILSAGISSAYASLLILITARVVGLSYAGTLSFAVAVSELLRILVMFGVRSYQSTDIGREFNFSEYLCLRTLSSLSAILVLVVLLLLGSFGAFRTAVLVLVFAIYLTDMYVDVFMGDLQQKGKMRIAGRMRVSGFGFSLLIFLLVALVARSLIPSLIFSGASLLCTYVAWIWIKRINFGKIQAKADFSVVKKLAKSTLPLAINGILFAYLYNAQKYYLGFIGSDEDVAIVTILMLPAMLLNIFFGFFFMGAELTRMAEIYTSGQLEKFFRRITHSLIFIGVSFVFFIIGVYFLGLPILSWFYGIDLSDYRLQLMLLSLGGVFLALYSLFGAVLIVLRLQNILLLCMASVAAVSGTLMWWLVSSYGLYGAAFSNLVIFGPLSISYCIAYYLWKKMRFRYE